MKLIIHSWPLAVALLNLGTSIACGQGSLTPPGPPGPTMKTLDQVEARTPIAGGTTAVTISQPGSYYLTGNITVASGDAISITAKQVTLDLNGYTVATTSASPSGTAVYLRNGSDQVTVRNGFIHGTGSAASGAYGGGGFQDGVNTERPVSEGSSVVNLTVDGCAGYGIRIISNGYGGTRVDGCMVENVGATGIAATIVTRCKAFYCIDTGISADEVSDCSGEGFVTGIAAGSATNSGGSGKTGIGLSAGNAHGCGGSSNSNVGLSATVAQNCTGSTQSTTASGLNATTAVGCHGFSVGGVGLFAFTASVCDGRSSSNIGLQVDSGSDCTGTTASGGYGLYGNILNTCQGIATGGTGTGLEGYYTATNCLGISLGGNGLYAGVAANCYGQTTDGSYGIYCRGSATNCRGYQTKGANIAIAAVIVVSCTTEGGTISGSKQLGTP